MAKKTVCVGDNFSLRDAYLMQTEASEKNSLLSLERRANSTMRSKASSKLLGRRVEMFSSSIDLTSFL